MVDRYVKRWLRGAWIATVSNIDWPSRSGLSKEEQQKEFVQLLDLCQTLKLNAVAVQIRPMADAFYPSHINPWSTYLTGTQGKSPGYDPLQFMVEACHQRCIEFHAWFNPYRVLLTEKTSELASNHPARKHPNWVVRYGGKLYYDPGLPEVRQHIVQSIEEVMQNYAIDAVHFDDYFYPYPVKGESFPDDQSFKKFGGHFKNRAEWRRDNVNQLVSEVSKRMKQLRASVRFGISPFGIWRNRSSDPAGSDSKGLESYDALYADTRKWVQKEWVDYVAPQLYWKIGNKAADYQKLLQWWVKQVHSVSVQLMIGQAAYRIEEWKDGNEIPHQLDENLSHPEVKGSLFFSLKDLSKNPLQIQEQLKKDYFRYYALLPPFGNLSQHPPTPQAMPTSSTREGVRLRWTVSSTADIRYFVIYRFAPDQKIDLQRSEAILAIVPKQAKTVHEYMDRTNQKPEAYQYLVTAVNQTYQESDPAKL
ncbi:Uncharacterized lipoprotein YddW, UPF0748 family [Seinonella peptonophila]|uniref:Uncharacterized lipoprotein YddW, UPF0748 family n=1 Tax=Seinonella peptonophila TaxID=112248 RepID=A0A1M4XHQ9_9BACL|nr:family 10 glycosylhydrolase [Seinonella peptonophila]SHE92940.1 Uncharacterized lipoprotein YddW, UPF0748 family [Seinonella peptonophila]